MTRAKLRKMTTRCGPEYDFSNSHTKSLCRALRRKNVHIALSRCGRVLTAFPDSQAVNEALRLLIKAARGAQELAAGKVG